jgi:hypothetical protein
VEEKVTNDNGFGAFYNAQGYSAGNIIIKGTSKNRLFLEVPLQFLALWATKRAFLSGKSLKTSVFRDSLNLKMYWISLPFAHHPHHPHRNAETCKRSYQAVDDVGGNAGQYFRKAFLRLYAFGAAGVDKFMVFFNCIYFIYNFINVYVVIIHQKSLSNIF